MREIPQEMLTKRVTWQRLANRYHWINNFLGFSSTGLTALIAANTRGQFLAPSVATTIAVLAACFAFLLTTFNAKTRAEAFELAGRELEATMERYRYDDSLTLKELGAGVARGIDILNRHWK
jgi:hypothetical protein